MKVKTAFRNLDSHGQHRGPEVIDEETKKIAERIKRFPQDLVRLEATVSQTKGKTRIRASLRLQLPSGVVAAQEEGFLIEPVLRKAFSDLGKRLDRHLERLKHEADWKRPARRAKLGTLLPPAPDQVEADRRALYFDLIDDHLDEIYNYVRRELTYLENSGAVRPRALSAEGLVDAVVIAGLDQFEKRPEQFSVGDWLRKLATQIVRREAQHVAEILPEDVEPIEEEPEVPAEEPTESDQEMFEFYQPDDVLLLEDIIADEDAEDTEDVVESHEWQMAMHRALADLPPLWRDVLICLYTDEMTEEQASRILDIGDDELLQIETKALEMLRARLAEGWREPADASEHSDAVLKQGLARVSRIPMPLPRRSRIGEALNPSENAKAVENNSAA